ncbi:MAG: DUF1127 domain-containing protein [Rhizobiales bacterium]|nr:DUF1127 domain-containing protein [Hyphomicrobiales bacterium]
MNSGFLVLRRPRGPGLALFAGIGASFARALAWPAHVMRTRRDLSCLSSMTDNELSDIGLSRQDLRDATALPLDSDPTRLFAERAAERARRAH